MKRFWIFAALCLVAVPAFAGGSGHECTASTQECLDYMANQLKNTGWVGVELEMESEKGPEVTKVVEGSPAEEAGIQPGDILVAINGIEVNDENGEKLQAARAGMGPGTSVTWSMARDDMDRKVAITLAPMPADILARYIGNHMLEHATVEVATK
jgi:C-terminal processing protease CtpA/Prc